MPFRDFNREQGWLLPPDLGELVGANHPARFAATFVEGVGDRPARRSAGSIILSPSRVAERMDLRVHDGSAFQSQA